MIEVEIKLWSLKNCIILMILATVVRQISSGMYHYLSKLMIHLQFYGYEETKVVSAFHRFPSNIWWLSTLAPSLSPIITSSNNNCAYFSIFLIRQIKSSSKFNSKTVGKKSNLRQQFLGFFFKSLLWLIDWFTLDINFQYISSSLNSDCFLLKFFNILNNLHV